MFGSLFRRAQATVDNVIDHAINRILVAIPFLVAVGFGTAALSMRLNREFGAEMGSLILAAGFVVLGGLAALVVHMRSSKPTEAPTEPAETREAAAEEAADPILEKADRDLLMAALTSAAPIALPGLLRAVMRNLPIVAAIAAAGFIMTRNRQADVLEPGE